MTTYEHAFEIDNKVFALLKVQGHFYGGGATVSPEYVAQMIQAGYAFKNSIADSDEIADAELRANLYLKDNVGSHAMVVKLPDYLLRTNRELNTLILLASRQFTLRNVTPEIPTLTRRVTRRKAQKQQVARDNAILTADGFIASQLQAREDMSVLIVLLLALVFFMPIINNALDVATGWRIVDAMQLTKIYITVSGVASIFLLCQLFITTLLLPTAVSPVFFWLRRLLLWLSGISAVGVIGVCALMYDIATRHESNAHQILTMFFNGVKISALIVGVITAFVMLCEIAFSIRHLVRSASNLNLPDGRYIAYFKHKGGLTSGSYKTRFGGVVSRHSFVYEDDTSPIGVNYAKLQSVL